VGVQHPGEPAVLCTDKPCRLGVTGKWGGPGEADPQGPLFAFMRNPPTMSAEPLGGLTGLRESRT
jgi:hypothetical protein